MREFTVVNQTGEVMLMLHVSPSTEDIWGDDRLGNTVVESGASYTTVLDTGQECVFDVKAVFYSSDDRQFSNVNVCQNPRLVLNPDTLFVVVNGSNEVLWRLYVSARQDDSWGEDRLGDDSTLDPGAEIQIPLATGSQGCRYDVKAEFGLYGLTPRAYSDVDVCKSQRLVIEPERLSIDANVPVGTAFYVSRDGKLITGHHVVDDCESIEVLRYSSQGDPLRSSARVLASSDELDIALLAINIEDALESVKVEVATFRALPKVRLGESVVTYGFPEGDTMSKHGVVSTGVVAALSGLHEASGGISVDHNQYQTTAPVHPGNSGSPLLDGGGLVLGVLVARRKDTNAAAYAVKAKSVMAFLETANVVFDAGKKETELPVPDVVENAMRYVVPVFCSALSRSRPR